jgi:hypothetical protein
MESCMPFLSASWCNRPKALRLDDADLIPTSPHHWWHAKKKPRSTRNNREQGASPHPFTPASATTTMRARSSTRVKSTKRMEPAVVTTLDGAAATIAGRTKARPLNSRDHEFSVKTSATHRS